MSSTAQTASTPCATGTKYVKTLSSGPFANSSPATAQTISLFANQTRSNPNRDHGIRKTTSPQPVTATRTIPATSAAQHHLPPAAPTNTAARNATPHTHCSWAAPTTRPHVIPTTEGTTPQNETNPDNATPVRARRLEALLEGYHKKEYIISGISEGFMLHFNGPQTPLSSHNSSSVKLQKEIVRSKIQLELSLGRIAGPFTKPPFDNFKTSPLALREKSTPGKYRLLHNLSYPYDLSSVNFNIPKSHSTVQYQNIQDAIALIHHHSPAPFMTKTDISEAFRIIPVHPSQYNLLGFKFDGKFYHEKMLSMGAATSCRIFEDFSDSLLWILNTRYNITSVVKVLDDFLFIHHDRDQCLNYLQTFLDLCSYLGVPIAHHKTEGPSNIITFLGIQLDTISMEARLPPDKLSSYSDDVATLAKRSSITLRQLKSVIGKLTFTTSVIPSGRAFLRRLHNLTIGHNHPNATISLSHSAKKDLTMWSTFLAEHNGCTLIRPLSHVTSEEIALCADSSKTGFGATYGSSWIQGYWPARWTNLHITVLELYPIFVTISLFSRKLQNSRINFFSDNMAVVQIINKQSSKCHFVMQILRPLVLILLNHNIHLRSSHIPGVLNVLCDAISRQQVTPSLLHRFGANPLPTTIPQHLQPANFRLNWTPP